MQVRGLGPHQEESCVLGCEPDAGLRLQVEDRQMALGIQGGAPAQGAGGRAGVVSG